MAILNRLYPLMPALLLTGCYHNFTPDTDTVPVLCMNSLITAGEPIVVELSHTWRYSDGDGAGDNAVDDAAVSLFANGIPVQSGYIPQEGDLIRIEASSSRYGKAWAEVMVPEAVPVTVLEAVPRLTRVGQYTGTGVFVADVTFDMHIRLAVDDIAGTDNYFHYACDGYISDDGKFVGLDDWTSYISTGSFKYESEPIFAEHIGVLESVSGSDAWGFTFFTDRQFRGGRYSLNLQYVDANVHIDDAIKDVDSLPECGLEICLSSVSGSYYNWANYCWQMDSGLIGDLGDIGLGDPQWGYSNVSTGAGVVAARSTSVCRINLSEFVRNALASEAE